MPRERKRLLHCNCKRSIEDMQGDVFDRLSPLSKKQALENTTEMNNYRYRKGASSSKNPVYNKPVYDSKSRVHTNRSAESNLKGRLCAHYKYGSQHWRIRNMSDGLFIVRDTIFNQYTILPAKLEFAKYSMYDQSTLAVVCKQIISYTTFAVPSFPLERRTLLVHENKNSMVDPYDICSYLDLDLDQVSLEYCYEGKYMRIFRYKGVTRVTSLNHINIAHCYENYVEFQDLVSSTGIKFEDLFDENVACSDQILHVLVSCPSANIRTRRPVVGCYTVLLGIELMSSEALGTMSHLPVENFMLDELLHQDLLEEALGSFPGKLLLPAIISPEEAPKILNGYDGEFIIVRNVNTKEVIGRICSEAAFDTRRLVPSNVTAKTIAVECLNKSSDVNFDKKYLLNFKRRNLKEFISNLEHLELAKGDEVADVMSHPNWQVLSSVCYLYGIPMRRCIAQCASNIQLEVALISDLCKDNDIPMMDMSFEDFNLKEVLEIVSLIYKTLPKVREQMKILTPALYNLMKPQGEDKARESCGVLNTRDATYQSIGCPEVRRLPK